MERGNVLDVLDYGYGGCGIFRGFEYHWIFIGSKLTLVDLVDIFQEKLGNVRKKDQKGWEAMCACFS